jgi:protein SCO1
MSTISQLRLSAVLSLLLGMGGVVSAQNEVVGLPKNEAEAKRALEDKPTRMPSEMQGVGVEEKLGQKIDLDLTFIAEDGYPHSLREYFAAGKPVILNLVYFTCPMLCNLTLNGQVGVLRDLAWTPGREFQIVTVSIDPTETFELARTKKQAYLSNFDKPGMSAGWHFLVDHQANVKKLAEQIGFRYRLDESQKQYAHSAAIFVLTPDGTISRYLYGIKFKERDLRLALTEASAGKFGLSFEKLMLMCFHYDPSSKSYVLFATNVMRFGGFLIVLVLAVVLFRYWREEILARKSKDGSSTTPSAGKPGAETPPPGNGMVTAK